MNQELSRAKWKVEKSNCVQGTHNWNDTWFSTRVKRQLQFMSDIFSLSLSALSLWFGESVSLTSPLRQRGNSPIKVDKDSDGKRTWHNSKIELDERKRENKASSTLIIVLWPLSFLFFGDSCDSRTMVTVSVSLSLCSIGLLFIAVWREGKKRKRKGKRKRERGREGKCHRALIIE